MSGPQWQKTKSKEQEVGKRLGHFWTQGSKGTWPRKYDRKVFWWSKHIKGCFKKTQRGYTGVSWIQEEEKRTHQLEFCGASSRKGKRERKWVQTSVSGVTDWWSVPISWWWPAPEAAPGAGWTGWTLTCERHRWWTAPEHIQHQNNGSYLYLKNKTAERWAPSAQQDVYIWTSSTTSGQQDFTSKQFQHQDNRILHLNKFNIFQQHQEMWVYIRIVQQHQDIGSLHPDSSATSGHWEFTSK